VVCHYPRCAGQPRLQPGGRGHLVQATRSPAMDMQRLRTQLRQPGLRWVFGLWKSRCTERILILRDPRGFLKEALMRCMQEGPS